MVIRVNDISRYIDLANKFNITYIGDSIPSSTKTTTKWICNNGHIFEKSYTQINNKHKCPLCSNRKTLQSYIDLAKSLNYTFLETVKPKSVLNKVKWKCDKGHIFEKRFNDLSNGSKCQFCAPNRKLLLENYKLVGKDKGIEFLGTSLPKNNKVKVDWACSNKHVFRTDYATIQSGHGCPVCTGNKKLTTFDYTNLAEKNNLVWIGGKLPKNNTTATDWKCGKCSNIWRTRYNTIDKGAECIYCNGHNIKASSDYVRLGEKLDIKWVGDKLPNRTQSITSWYCNKCNSRFNTSYFNLMARGHCIICENGNPKLTVDDYNGLASKKSLIWIGDKLPKNRLEKTKWRCIKSNHISNISYSYVLDNIGCTKCTHTTKGELELLDFINSTGLYAEKKVFSFTNDEKLKMGLDTKKTYRYELDIFIPELNIGIEYDGIYWHSFSVINNSNNKDGGRDLHINKYNFFKSRRIEVINVFEGEWLYKKDIVKSILLSRLNKIKNRIMARKCTIVSQSVNKFLDINHIQGRCGSMYSFSLVYKNEIVAAMTLGKSRFENNRIELLRFSNKLNTSVIGGFSKLLKHALKVMDTNEIITYCNLRYFSGAGYLKNNFQYVSTTKPNYFYFHKSDKLNLLSRHKFQKHKLEGLLEKFDNNLSEYENMKNNGYDKIYDAGNLKLKYTVK